MLKLIRSNNDNLSYVRKFLQNKNINDVYVINEDNINLGIIEYKENDGYFKIELIEIEKQYRNKGIGKKVVKSLLQLGDVIGDCLPNVNVVSFWESLEAEFEEDIEDCIENECCIPFTIYQN